MGFLKKHTALFWGLGLTLLFLCFGFPRTEFFVLLELKFYDMCMNLRGDSGAPSDIVLVDIDDDSIEKLGRWPLPRALIADGIRKINAGGPKVIGLNLTLSEPDWNSGLNELKGLEDHFKNTALTTAGDDGHKFSQALAEARTRLDDDANLEGSIRESQTVVLPFFFKGMESAGKATPGVVELLSARSVQGGVAVPGTNCPSAGGIVIPMPAFLKASRGIGHNNLIYDIDGKIRRENLLIEYSGLYLPSFSLTLAALFLDVPPEKIGIDPQPAVTLNKLKIPASAGMEYYINYKGPKGSFKNYSFVDVLNDKVPASAFKNKLVLVSTTASGIAHPLSTPASLAMPRGELLANSIWSILNRHSIHRPAWGFIGEILLLILSGLILTFLLPRMNAGLATVTFVLLLGTILGGTTLLFVAKGLWISPAYPAVLLVTGYIGLARIRYFTSEVSKEKVDDESAEANRMLGLSLQNQGLLDMAFDKLRRVPVDDGMKDNLYNLALDYERKRQFSKAVTVYEYIEQHDALFKDISERRKKLVQASETAVLGAGLNGDPMISTGTDTRPTLGRYEVVKQLGKGAMGIVYLGQDPRINRITAIKTFRFADSLDPEEVERLREKFFVEAESAGTLSHPNIVTIYDAGEEQDLAYIAMEFLDGEDLQNYTKEGGLLPIRHVISHTADVADALDYAHEKGIVHRDIKPANVMLLKNGIVKLTDFGIARIATSSRTQTGVVKGTPFYMSPEQISGRKVDGRSDIFSLGVMQYQLLTGRTPFNGDNLAALMHQIMNVPHPDPRQFNPRIPKALVDILGKSLEKDRDRRYLRASHMAAHLRQLGKLIDDAMAKKEIREH